MTYNIDNAKSDLDNIPTNLPLFQRMLSVSAIITKIMSKLVKETDMPIIVGGFSLEIYTESEYTTHDIDFVSSASILMEEKLMEMGFIKTGRLFQYEKLNVTVDIVDDTLDPPNYASITKLQLPDDKYVYVQSIENILYDRSLDYDRVDNQEYSIYLISTRSNDIDFEYLRNKLAQADLKALQAFNEWVRIAIGD